MPEFLDKRLIKVYLGGNWYTIHGFTLKCFQEELVIESLISYNKSLFLKLLMLFYGYLVYCNIATNLGFLKLRN